MNEGKVAKEGRKQSLLRCESVAMPSNTQNDEGNSIIESNHKISLSSSTPSPLKQRIYVDKDQSWELTWPIWHMLPRSERKSIAQEHGYRTIGDFEEHMSLTRALGRDSTHKRTEVTGENIHKHNEQQLTTKVEETYENDNVDCQEVNSTHSIDNTECLAEDKYSTNSDHEESYIKARNQAFLNGGRILKLPDEILIYRILAYLDVDYFASCALVSPHWKTFTRTEAVYKQICERCYLQQSKRKELHVARFGNSYWNMLFVRPRLKTGCGLYVLKFSQIKKIQRDMWTEIPIGAVLETTYYRYAYFQENGKVLYALSPLPPHEMIPKFVKIRKEYTITDHKSGVVWGTYQVQKFQVTVHVSHPWHDVKLELNILENGCDEANGRFWALSMERHFSSASGDFDEYWSRDLVEYSVPHQPFVFLRDWRL